MAELGRKPNDAKANDETPASPRTRWLRAAFGAPMLLFVCGASLTVCFGDGTFVTRLGASIRGIILAPFAALLYGVVLVLVDLALAVTRLRPRPVGAKAWMSAAVATLAGGALVGGLGLAVRGTISDEAFAGIALVLLFATAFGARLVLAKRAVVDARAAIDDEPAPPKSLKRAR